MNRIFHLSSLAACAAALTIAGCANSAGPGPGSRVLSPQRSPIKSHQRFDFAAPQHVLTWAAIVQSYNISPTAAAPYLNWAVVNVPDSNAWSAAGIKTVLYTDPNRTTPLGRMYTPDETTFAHDCLGNRITVVGKSGPDYQMDPRSPNTAAVWQSWVTGVLEGNVHYDAIFDDSADSVRALSALPCNFDQPSWTAASNTMNHSLGQTVVFNGLGTLTWGNQNPPPALGLYPTAVGGMLEGCYANLDLNNPMPKRALWQNYENSEIAMSNLHKMFICRSFAAQPAQTSYNLRTYMYASFLLSYDPATSVISEKFSTASHLEVEPESGLVALNPLIPEPTNISGLNTATYTYGRQYADCYLNGQSIGACAAVVNADGPKQVHPFPWPGVYTHTLVLNGGGVLDGGTASATGPAPSTTIAGTSAVIAIQ